jgi:hypothetical protein
VKIKILGMRGLQSLGLMPVKRPFIKINMNSFKKVSDSAQGSIVYPDICTEPKEAGSNPNIGDVLNFQLSLP